MHLTRYLHSNKRRLFAASFAVSGLFTCAMTHETLAQESIAPAIAELSVPSMIASADIVVKTVMALLLLASIANLMIFLAKTYQLSRAYRRVRSALAGIGQSRSLQDAQTALRADDVIVADFVGAAIHEMKMSEDSSHEQGIKERVASRLAEISRGEGRAIRFGMGLLATIGSTSPFIGLFGTVWGIMNSFIGISKSQTTNLAIVAPGIAEALLATAFGLFAAIPAVILYNYFARSTRGYLDQVNDASGAVMRLLSRDLDRAGGWSAGRAAE